MSLTNLTKNAKKPFYTLPSFQFVYNLTVCGKNNDNEPINEFVLSSPAPVDIAAKLSSILLGLSTRVSQKRKSILESREFEI